MKYVAKLINSGLHSSCSTPSMRSTFLGRDGRRILLGGMLVDMNSGLQV